MEWLVVNEGYKAIIAESVKKAIQIIQDQKPQLIILDLQMPEVSGYDFLEMKDSLNIQDVPIIVVSANDLPENVEAIKKLGATDFHAKPIKIDVLLQLIKKYLP
jgi:CheY-like chemotaxis protein